MMKHAYLLLLILVSAITISCGGFKGPNKNNTIKLQTVFPIIEQYKVQAYRNQDWCKNISYEKGKFSNNIAASTCNLFSGKPESFNNQAQTDFNTIANAFSSIGINILFIDIRFDKTNKIAYAEFHLDCSFCSRPRYVYEPHYQQLPETVKGEIWHTKIDDNWYLTEEDWN